MSVRAFSRREGSALLIVLGFLSFMVVSAVAFAIFMRGERAPSSALRRSVATRHLVKAALARAISAVDDSLRDDVYPGCPGTGNLSEEGAAQTPYRDKNGGGADMDLWFGRVFMPPDPDGYTKGNGQITDGDSNARFASADETVSVLNLEGLGYLPPPLINDVRFLARCSYSSKWRNLPYDAGRCAYVAVNVSDYFDINRLQADSARSSGDDGCVSLSGIFLSDAAGTKIDEQAASDFDLLVHGSQLPGGNSQDYAPIGNTAPLVSLLDYNLALGSQFKSGLGSGYLSPFSSWVDPKESPRDLMYGTKLEPSQDDKTARASRQTFVTGSWFPQSRNSSDKDGRNLLHKDGQPFKQDVMKLGAKCPAARPVGTSSGFKTAMNNRNYFSYADWCSLYDYLDQDDVPLSLALPSTERIPMVVAFTPVLNPIQFQCAVTKEEGKENETEDGYTKVTTTTCRFKAGTTFPGNLAMNAVFAFPFKRGQQFNSQDDGFDAQAMTRVFLVASPAGTDVKSLPLRSSTADLFKNLRPKPEEWNGGAKFFRTERGGTLPVFTYVSAVDHLQYPSTSVEEANQAFMNGGNKQFSLALAGAQEAVFFVRTEREQMTKDGRSKSKLPTAWEFPSGEVLFGPDGSAVNLGEMKEGDAFEKLQLTVCAASWIRVDNGDEQVVDYAPAVLHDDEELNHKQMVSAVPALNIYHGPTGDDGTEASQAALLPVVNSQAVLIQNILAKAAESTGAEVQTDAIPADYQPRSYFAVDPRYNWAPEDWLPKNETASSQSWLNSLAGVLGADGRDPDIFMGYSNQGYLQSMGEISMLPRLTDEGGSTIGVTYDGMAREVGASWEKIAHANTVWRTYPADYLENSDLRKLFANDKLGNNAILAEGKGFRVNPFTESPSILRAALACTPCDWWSAGTKTEYNTSFSSGDGYNKTSNTLKEKMLGSAKEARKFAFCSENPEVEFSEKTVSALATTIWTWFQTHRGMSWEKAWDALWAAFDEEDENHLLGVDLNEDGIKLHDVDRKYLYAYWRGCFANKQQLFLIFVRAESNALGGTQAQKGGRAVALVWREPGVPKPIGSEGGDSEETLKDQDHQTRYQYDRHPHRTRVLFYHQFD